MITLKGDALAFAWPEVHRDARCTVSFQRTLRIPDDGREYPLPAALGRFPLRHVDDHAGRVPAPWIERGGVILPMHQAEAMWISFARGGYPVAIKVAAGKVNAVSGQAWSTALHGPDLPARGRRATGRGRSRRGRAVPQDYVVVPEQPWLDGFNVAEGRIRQFVAMPLGGGHTAEEQLTGRADVGGVQLLAYPMKAERYEAMRAAPPPLPVVFEAMSAPRSAAGLDMGLGLGGMMRQDIEADPHGADAWDLDHPARCFVHLANAALWTAITGEPMPTQPITPAQYRAAGIPWFDYSAPGTKVSGSDVLGDLATVGEVEAESGRRLPEAEIPIDRVHRLPARRRSGASVREAGGW